MVDKAATGFLGQDVVLSVVVPMYNEADNIDPFLERLERVLDDVVAHPAARPIEHTSPVAFAERMAILASLRIPLALTP